MLGAQQRGAGVALGLSGGGLRQGPRAQEQEAGDRRLVLLRDRGADRTLDLEAHRLLAGLHLTDEPDALGSAGSQAPCDRGGAPRADQAVGRLGGALDVLGVQLAAPEDDQTMLLTGMT